MPKVFWIEVEFQRKKYRYHVLHEPVDKLSERFTITIRSQKPVFESNRPYLKFRTGLKRWAPKFTLKSSQMTNFHFHEILVETLKMAIKELEL
jgi:hypothetical protein